MPGFSMPTELTSHISEGIQTSAFWSGLCLRMQIAAYENKQNLDLRFLKTNIFTIETVRDYIKTISGYNFFITTGANGDYCLFYDWGVVAITSYTLTGEVVLWGDPIEVQKWLDTHPLWKVDSSTVNVDWCFRERDNIQKLQVNVKITPILESAYPWIEKPIREYIDRFNQSTANVLIMIGVAGTGKTTLIKNILASQNRGYQDSVAMLTYDEELLYHDAFFCTFMGANNVHYMVIEDADNLLLNRTEGNNLMRKFLNIGDGLTTVGNKKIIFSTNLPNVHDIDNALLRPGRCFDVLQFRSLNYDESQAVLLEAGKKKELDPLRSYTLAELVADTEYVPPETKFGFTQ